MEVLAAFFASIIALFSGLLGYTSQPIAKQQIVNNVTNSSKTIPLTGNDLSTSTRQIIFTKGGRVTILSKDKNNVYVTLTNGDYEILKNADPSSFLIVSDNTGKDIYNDRETELDGGFYAKDKNHVYIFWATDMSGDRNYGIIDKADPETFFGVKDNKDYDAYDKNRKYLVGGDLIN